MLHFVNYSQARAPKNVRACLKEITKPKLPPKTPSKFYTLNFLLAHFWPLGWLRHASMQAQHL